MPFLDLPPQIQERVVCSISAAVKYEVPANIVLAVAEKEGGKPGQWVRNTNDAFDQRSGLARVSTRASKGATSSLIPSVDAILASAYSEKVSHGIA